MIPQHKPLGLRSGKKDRMSNTSGAVFGYFKTAWIFYINATPSTDNFRSQLAVQKRTTPNNRKQKSLTVFESKANHHDVLLSSRKRRNGTAIKRQLDRFWRHAGDAAGAAADRRTDAAGDRLLVRHDRLHERLHRRGETSHNLLYVQFHVTVNSLLFWLHN